MRIWILRYRRILLYFLDAVLLRTVNFMFLVAVENIAARLDKIKPEMDQIEII